MPFMPWTYIIVFTLFAVLVLAAIGFGVRYIFAKQKRFLNAMSTGYAEGAAAPGNATAPRGAGGYTAAETTAMADHMLQAFGRKSSSWVAPLDPKAQAEANALAASKSNQPIEPK